MRLFKVFILTVLAATAGFSTTVNQVGTYANWATSWTAITSANDPKDAGIAGCLDYVGDAANPGLYSAYDSSYVYFRMRVNTNTFTSSTAHGANLLLIDVVGYGTNGIDYAFAWDSKSNDNSKHGLEMCIHSVNGPTWGVSQVDDIDGNQGGKGTNDINGLISGSTYRTTDGYVRTVDGQTTTNLGVTSFIDFAVSWSYLATYTGLRSNQTWKVALASIDNATDANAFNADISGGASKTDLITTGWSAPVSAAIPEPASILMIGFGGGLIALIRRFYSRT